MFIDLRERERERETDMRNIDWVPCPQPIYVLTGD